MTDMFKIAYEICDDSSKELKDFGFKLIDLQKIGYDFRGGRVMYNDELDILVFTNPGSADYYLGIEYTSKDFRFEIKTPDFNWVWFEDASVSEESRISEFIDSMNLDKNEKKEG